MIDATKRAFVAGGAIFACRLFAGCASVAEPVSPGGASVPLPAVRVGQYWEYALRDGYTNISKGIVRYTVARTEENRIVLDVSRDGAPGEAQVYAPGWNGIEHALTNLQRFHFDPPLPAYQFPMYVGKSWRSAVRATDPATRKTYTVQIHARVVGSRRIRVPAGEFDALQVKRQVYAGNGEFFKLQEEIAQSDWYAPSIGQAVVSEGTSSHLDASRQGEGRRPLRVEGGWLIAELVRYSALP